MNKDKALQLVEQQLPKKRFYHTIGVLETAVKLAKKYGADEQKAELAAIFHDYAKYRPLAQMQEIVIEQNMDQALLRFDKELLHAPVGAYLVETEVGIKDKEIIDAIRYHTTGRPNMSLLEKVIYVADYIEPNRVFPGVEEVRNLANTDLNKALVLAVANTIHYLVEKKQPVFLDTLKTYNYLLLEEDF